MLSFWIRAAILLRGGTRKRRRVWVNHKRSEANNPVNGLNA
jgi:hypothetical protein